MVISEARIDFDFDWIRFNASNGGRTDLRQHGLVNR
jgi:hypothetical protein